MEKIPISGLMSFSVGLRDAFKDGLLKVAVGRFFFLF